MALGPVLPAAFARIAFLQLVLVLSLSLTVGVLPWRVRIANVIDCVCHVCLLAMILLSASFAEDKYLTEVANLCFIVAILMLCVLPIGLVIAGLKASQKSNKKEFQYFICHHKQGAGAMARLLKIRLKSTAGVKRKVFIDSDDLKDLTKLQDCVANDTESLVVLHSAGVLYRPWRVLEVATAKNMKLQLCRVDFLKCSK